MTPRNTPIRTLAATLVVASLLPPAAAFANSDGLPHVTGTGGGPLTTVTAPHTQGTGVTKPPGAALQGEAGELAAQHRRGQILSDRLQRSICNGC